VSGNFEREPAECLFCHQPGYLVSNENDCPARIMGLKHFVWARPISKPDPPKHQLVDLDCPDCGEALHGGDCEVGQ
jgi:hypothetical protein